jgi:hypothetical protein
MHTFSVSVLRSVRLTVEPALVKEGPLELFRFCDDLVATLPLLLFLLVQHQCILATNQAIRSCGQKPSRSRLTFCMHWHQKRSGIRSRELVNAKRVTHRRHSRRRMPSSTTSASAGSWRTRRRSGRRVAVAWPSADGWRARPVHSSPPPSASTTCSRAGPPCGGSSGTRTARASSCGSWSSAAMRRAAACPPPPTLSSGTSPRGGSCSTWWRWRTGLADCFVRLAGLGCLCLAYGPPSCRPAARAGPGQSTRAYVAVQTRPA